MIDSSNWNRKITNLQQDSGYLRFVCTSEMVDSKVCTAPWVRLSLPAHRSQLILNATDAKYHTMVTASYSNVVDTKSILDTIRYSNVSSLFIQQLDLRFLVAFDMPGGCDLRCCKPQAWYSGRRLSHCTSSRISGRMPDLYMQWHGRSEDDCVQSSIMSLIM